MNRRSWWRPPWWRRALAWLFPPRPVDPDMRYRMEEMWKKCLKDGKDAPDDPLEAKENG